MRFLRLFSFHFSQYLNNNYFFWLTITNTVSIFLLQYIAAYASNNLVDPMIWLKSGVFGMWASCTTAAGSIGYQRLQGTLPYLVNTRYDQRLSLIALLLPASVYGLMAFPISFLLARVFTVSVGKITIKLIISIFLLWIADTTMGVFIASFFTLSPNALVYESLINIPIVLLAGLFGDEKILTSITKVSRWFIPMAVPIQEITKSTVSANWMAFIVSLFLWVSAIIFCVGKINNLAMKKGVLKII